MSVEVFKALSLLGSPVKDRVTGFTGVVSSMSFDLYGCIQAAITPPVAVKDGEAKLPDGRWFDIIRLDVTGEKVLAPPTFATADRGPAEKPAPRG